MAENFNILIDKLDRFIRRYYLNLLLKGSLLFGAGFLILFLGFVVLEYFGYFNESTRFVLFYSFLIFNAFVLIRYVIFPLMGLARIGKRLGPTEAARILGIYFKDEVSDKITNTLQLKKYLDEHPENVELVMAGIDQKASLVSTVPFQKAINLKSNLRFLPFFMVPLVFILAFFIIKPAFILEPAQRIVRYDLHFEKPSPFIFEMINEGQGFRNENLKIEMKSRGEALPENAVLHLRDSRFNMENEGKGLFSYNIRNLQESFEMMIEAEGFMFGPFQVEVLQKPLVHQFSVNVKPPAYTGLGAEQYSNVGDIIVPRGSAVTWEFNTRGTGTIEFYSNGKPHETLSSRQGVYQVDLKAMESFDYKVFATNEQVGAGDSIEFFVQVQPDAYPRIEVEEFRDSVMVAHVFHRGVIQDDYGFNRLEFNYRLLESAPGTGDDESDFLKEIIDIEKGTSSQEFFHHLDINSLYVQPGETVEYFFIVFDNDGINGPKGSRSSMFSFYVPTTEEMIAQQRKADQQIKSEISDGIGDVQKARDEIQELRKQLLDSPDMNWEQREAVESLLDKQQQVQETMEELARQKKENEVRNEQFQDINEKLREKQEELSKLFEEVLPDELKELFEKIRQELDQLNKEQVYEMLDQMDFEFKDMEMQMDRALELFKQLEMERMLQQSIDMLDQARNEQGELNEETGEESESEELSQKQEEVNEKFEKTQEMLEEFREKNEELMRPQSIDDTSEMEESIMEDLQEALEQLQKNNPGGSQGPQQQGKKKMDQLSDQLSQMQQNMFEQQLAEDAHALRQILENLLKSSFSQEELMLEIKEVNVNDPRFVELVQVQRKIRDDLRMVEDSLMALSKRQMQIQGFVTREIAEVNMNLTKAMEDLVQRRRFNASSRQQFVMTHINNLALLLNESLQNMQNQMAQQQGMGQPNQSGQGEPSFQGLKQMQEELNKMLQQMQQGHQPMPGESGEGKSMSEQLARMAAEQEAIRNQLKKIADDLKSDGLDVGPALEQLQKEMERTELDIVTKNITRQTIQRQQRILTRLLEHEKAELEREKEERREATTAENYDISNPAELFEYNRKRNNELEMLKRLPVGLRPFYKSLVENYFLNVE